MSAGPPAEKQRLREAQETAEVELRAKSAPYARFQAVKSARADEVQTALPLPHLEGARNLHIAPDGPLDTVPFEALTAEDGQSLIQRMPAIWCKPVATLWPATGARPARGWWRRAASRSRFFAPVAIPAAPKAAKPQIAEVMPDASRS